MAYNLQQLAAHDHFASASTAPGRPRRYLSGGRGLLPHSCTLYVFKDVPDAIAFTARSLKTGSGVKAIFDKDFELSLPKSIGNMHLACSTEHPDHDKTELFNRHYLSELDNATVLVVQDSMETEQGLAGQCGIIESFNVAYKTLCAGKDLLIDLSNLRPAGSNKSDGYNVTSSGPASFALIYDALHKHLVKQDMLTLLQLLGVLNAVILKGGYKRGIVTSMMHTDCKHIDAYLSSPTEDLAGSHKKGVIVSKAVATQRRYAKLRQRICQLVNTESIFLQKDAADLGDAYAGTYSNVCVGIMLPDRGTCLIWRVNLGKISTKQQLIDAYVLATEQCVSLHRLWHDNQPRHTIGLWQPIENDRQVAIDPVGLANMLKQHGYTYKQLIEELEAESYADESLAQWFAEAYQASTARAQELAAELGLPSFLRLHTVEPAQSHAFELHDDEGDTLCRGIWPPFDQVVNRVSDNERTLTVDHGDVETVADLGPDLIFRLNNAWQRLMNKHGLPHCISMDIYEYVDESWLQRWYESNLLTAYYQFAGAYDQSYSRKQVEDVDIGDEFLSEFAKAAKAGPVDSEAEPTCPLSKDPAQRAECSVCAE